MSTAGQSNAYPQLSFVASIRMMCHPDWTSSTCPADFGDRRRVDDRHAKTPEVFCLVAGEPHFWRFFCAPSSQTTDENLVPQLKSRTLRLISCRHIHSSNDDQHPSKDEEEQNRSGCGMKHWLILSKIRQRERTSVRLDLALQRFRNPRPVPARHAPCSEQVNRRNRIAPFRKAALELLVEAIEPRSDDRAHSLLRA